MESKESVVEKISFVLLILGIIISVWHAIDMSMVQEIVTSNGGQYVSAELKDVFHLELFFLPFLKGVFVTFFAFGITYSFSKK